MATTKPVTPPAVSQFARAVVADLKGGAAAHSFRVSLAHAAILEALKGNPNNWNDAIRHAEGKSRKALAYQAAFAAVGRPSKLPYEGSLSADHNKEVRQQLHAEAARLSALWGSTFTETEEAAKAAAKTKAEEAKAAKTKAEAAQEAASAVQADNTPQPATQPDAEVLRAAAVATVLDAIRSGMLSAAELEAIDSALELAAVQHLGRMPAESVAVALTH